MKMKKPIIGLLLATVIFEPFRIMAHAGHGHDNPLSPGHYITNPEHSVLLLLTVAASIAFAWFINRGSRIKDK